MKIIVHVEAMLAPSAFPSHSAETKSNLNLT